MLETVSVPMFIISVWNCRAVVSRRVDLPDGGCSYQPAVNWEALEDRAIAEVEGQGGAVNLSGHYACPISLLASAAFP